MSIKSETSRKCNKSNFFVCVNGINELLYCTVAVYSWSMANNFVIDFNCRCLEILCQIALSSVANYFRF